MAVYEYKAINKATGKGSKGVIDAESPAQARQKLRDQDLFPTDIVESANMASARSGGNGKPVHKGGGGRVSSRDLAMLTRQFAVLLRAGMPLVDALSAMQEQTSKPRLQSALYDIRDNVNSGTTLADALGKHPRLFSNLYVNMVRAGEVSGTLEEVLFRLAEIQEHQSKLKGQLMSSLAYPVFMGLFAIAVVVFLMMFIVPRITLIFEKQEAALPKPTLVLIACSDFLGSYWPLIIGAILGTFFLWRYWISQPKGRLKWDRMKLRFPLYGGLHLKLVCARFARTLGTMLQSGLTMLPALEVVNSVLDNAYFREHMDEVKAGVRRGRDLSQQLKETGMFPSMMIHMVELGQRSGEIEDMLIKVADTYDEDVRLTIDAMVGLIEPVIIIVMGVFVGFLVISILLPILNMSQNL
jgi:general secretion pathway protein F